MKAAVLRGGHMVVDEVADPVPGEGQVLVRTEACGICGSDLHAAQHADRMTELTREAVSSAGVATGMAPLVFDSQQDLVMGHEFAAEVLELGPGAVGVSPGQTVVSVPVVADQRGIHAVGYSNDYPGGYAERMLLSAGLLLPVPNGLDTGRAALTEPMAVGVHAVNRSAIAPGSAALVIGAGPVGLAVIAALGLRAIEPIVAADFSPRRRQLATTMGAHEVVDPREEPAIDAWRRIGARHPLVIFEAVGVPGVIDQAMRAAPQQAEIVVVGVCMETDQLQPFMGITKELTVKFSMAYNPMEFASTLQSIAEGTLDVSPLITGTVGIDGVPQAFSDLANPDAHAKIVVDPKL
ncbi:MAG: zinc-binding dehydrogenase [Acidimicrobiia bacterium]|nr:zinc-binding dehydrogenase [Acidimicrobiia bacterium]